MKERVQHGRVVSCYPSSTQNRVLGPRGDVHDGSQRLSSALTSFASRYDNLPDICRVQPHELCFMTERVQYDHTISCY